MGVLYILGNFGVSVFDIYLADRLINACQNFDFVARTNGDNILVLKFL